MKNETAGWQELQSTWISAAALEEYTTANLKASLEWRWWMSRAWWVIEVLAFVFLGVVAVALALHGSYLQAAALAVVTLFCLALSLWARRVPMIGNEASLLGMVDLTISRARRSLRLAYTSYVGVAMMLGTAIYRAHAPWSEDDELPGRLVLVTFFLIGTAIYHAYAHRRLRHYEAMRKALSQ